MKRPAFLKYLKENGCVVYREGANHTVVVNMEKQKVSVVPRHPEIKNILANEICKQLDIPKILIIEK